MPPSLAFTSTPHLSSQSLRTSISPLGTTIPHFTNPTVLFSIPPGLDESTGQAFALSNELNVAVFVVGLVPFLWATYEFWRRIAFGESFGTGSDSVVIGKEGDKVNSRGR